MATPRSGRPYIWATWLAKLLGGHRCVWSVWFKARYRYDRYEEQAADLARWNRAHSQMMAHKRRALELLGWTCTEEEANAFRLEGATAIVAGKPDLIAVKGDDVMLVDGKTGRERDSDLWQMLIYLYALPLYRPAYADKRLEGVVHYRETDYTLTPLDLEHEGRRDRILALIQTVAASTPPPKAPSRAECRVCNIGPRDCPERVQAAAPTPVGEF